MLAAVKHTGTDNRRWTQLRVLAVRLVAYGGGGYWLWGMLQVIGNRGKDKTTHQNLL